MVMIIGYDQIDPDSRTQTPIEVFSIPVNNCCMSSPNGFHPHSDHKWVGLLLPLVAITMPYVACHCLRNRALSLRMSCVESHSRRTAAGTSTSSSTNGWRSAG